MTVSWSKTIQSVLACGPRVLFQSVRKLQNKMALLCCETLVRGRSCCLRKESHGSENKHCEAFFPPSGEHSVGAMWSAVHLPSFPRCALFSGVRRFVARMIFVDPIRRRVFLGFAVGVDWADFLDGTICFHLGRKLQCILYSKMVILMKFGLEASICYKMQMSELVLFSVCASALSGPISVLCRTTFGGECQKVKN